MTALKKNDYSHMILLSNIKQLISEHGITEVELSRQTDIPQSTLNKLLSGYTFDPKITMIKKIANYFHQSVDQLYSQIKSDEYISSNLFGHYAPILSWEECIDKSNNVLKESTKSTNLISLDYKNNGNIFALQTKMSMEPKFPNNTTLIINEDVSPNDGDIVIVKYNKINNATIKIISIFEDEKFLFDLNKSESSKLKDLSVIIGVVIEARYNYT